MNLVKELRLRAGMSQKELSIEAHVSRATISDWESQKKDPKKKENIDRLAEIFNVDPAIILGFQIGNANIPTSNTDKVIRVPVLGSIPAGIPIEAIEDILDWEELPAEWGKGGKEYFALKISGESMFPEYRSGDVVIFRKQDTCESGQDCAVMVNGDEATFKRVKISERGVLLQAINPDYDSYAFSNAEWQEKNGRVIGVAVKLERNL